MDHVQTNLQYRDGGYGWIVVASAFIVAGITDGIGFSYGVVLLDLVEEFQSSRGQTALVGGLTMCFYSGACTFIFILFEIGMFYF